MKTSAIMLDSPFEERVVLNNRTSKARKIVSTTNHSLNSSDSKHRKTPSLEQTLRKYKENQSNKRTNCLISIYSQKRQKNYSMSISKPNKESFLLYSTGVNTGATTPKQPHDKIRRGIATNGNFSKPDIPSANYSITSSYNNIAGREEQQNCTIKSMNYYKMAMDQKDKKNYTVCVNLLSNAINCNSKNFDALYERGCHYIMLKQYRKAALDFQCILNLKPNYRKSVYTYLADVLCKLNSYDDAINTLSKLLEKCHQYIEGIQMRGDIYMKINKYDMALQDYGKIIKIDANLLVGYTKSIDCLIKLKKYNESLKVANEGIEKNIECNKELLNKRAYLYYKLGQYELAKADIESIPSYADSILSEYYMGKILIKMSTMLRRKDIRCATAV